MTHVNNLEECHPILLCSGTWNYTSPLKSMWKMRKLRKVLKQDRETKDKTESLNVVCVWHGLSRFVLKRCLNTNVHVRNSSTFIIMEIKVTGLQWYFSRHKWWTVAYSGVSPSSCTKIKNVSQSTSWRKDTGPRTGFRGTSRCCTDVLFERFFMNHTVEEEVGWPSCGEHCYALRLSMIKSGSCCFGQCPTL